MELLVTSAIFWSMGKPGNARPAYLRYRHFLSKGRTVDINVNCKEQPSGRDNAKEGLFTSWLRNPDHSIMNVRTIYADSQLLIIKSI